MSESKEYSLEVVLPPVVEVKRGYGYHLNAGVRGDLFAYTNGQNVYLRSLADPSVTRVFSEHKHKTTVAKFSPNGRHVASGDCAGNVLIWEVLDNSFSLRHSYPINSSIYDLAWSPDCKRIIAVGEGAEQKAKAFMVDSGNTIGEITGHIKTILSADFKPTRPYAAITSSEDMLVGFHKGPPFKFDHTYKEHKNYVNCVRYSPDGTKSCSVSSDKSITIYEGKTGEVQLVFGKEKGTGHTGSIYNVCWSPDSTQVLTVSADRSARIWNVADGSLAVTFNRIANPKKPQVGEMQMGCLWYKEYILTVALDGSITYLDINNPDVPLKVLQGPVNVIKGFVVDKTNNTVYCGDTDGKLTQWDLSSKTGKWYVGKGHGKAIVGLAMGGDNQVMTIGRDDNFRLNSTDPSVGFSDTSVSLGGACIEVQVSNKDPSLFAAVTAQGSLVVIKDGKVASTVEVGVDPTCVTWSSDDSQIWVGTKKQTVLNFNVAEGKTTKGSVVVTGFSKPVNGVFASPTGDIYAATDLLKAVTFFNNAGEILNINKWQYHDCTITTAGFNPSGTKFATGAADGHMFVYSDLVKFTPAKVALKNVSPQGVYSLGWIDDSNIVTCGVDRAIRIFKLN